MHMMRLQMNINNLILEINMKQINNNLVVALLRGAATLSGLMATMTVALFTESLHSLILTLLIGAIAITLIDEMLK